MLEVITLKVGSLEENCYIVPCGGGEAAVIDPGDEAGRIIRELQERELRCSAILLTHGHFDHTGALEELVLEYGAQVFCGQQDGWRLKTLPDRSLNDGDRIEVGEKEFRVLGTPGHTEGSVCYIIEDCIFTGDTLFFETVGRTDLPGGDEKQLSLSLARLRELPEQELRLFPGHMQSTTLSHERQHNPYLCR